MVVLPAEMMIVLNVFAPVFTKPSFNNAITLVAGSLLSSHNRRVSTLLRQVGLSQSETFSNYHRFFNRAKYNCCNLSKILLSLLLQLMPQDAPILVAVDDTLERRRGKKITAKGCYRDAVRSTEKEVVTCYGLKWLCLTLLVQLPWNQRHWALPVMTILAPSKRYRESQGKSHRTINEWTMLAVKVVSRWLKRPWILIGDGAFACIRLAWCCSDNGVTLVSRLRIDAALYEFPGEPRVPTLGRPASKGARLASLKQLAEDNTQPWQTIQVVWYGGKEKELKVLTSTSLWHRSGEKPLPIRWVLSIDPDTGKAESFFATDLDLSPKSIIEWFVLRWNIEVTFEEVRAHLGFETQRQWSDRAIKRTTPLLMGLFSLACLFAKEMLKGSALPVQNSAWYQKCSGGTFSDVMSYLKREIWSQRYFVNSGVEAEVVEIPGVEAREIIEQLCRAA